MEVSVRYILNVFWKIHFSGWVPLPCFGKPWNPALMVWWSESDVISNVKILIRPIRVLMARAGRPHRAVARREGMCLEWFWSPLWVWDWECRLPGEFLQQKENHYDNFMVETVLRKRFQEAKRSWPILILPQQSLLGRMLVFSAWKYRHWKGIFLLSFSPQTWELSTVLQLALPTLMCSSCERARPRMCTWSHRSQRQS